MKTKITVFYYLRKSKVNAQAQMPIYQRITINGQRFDLSTGLFVEEQKWSSERSKMKGNTEEARMFNGRLDMMRAIVYETEKKLFMNQVEITFESFKNEFQGKKERARMLIPIFQEHNRKIKELVGQEYAPGTLERYETLLKHTEELLEQKEGQLHKNILLINEMRRTILNRYCKK